jgi:hypothetical protein
MQAESSLMGADASGDAMRIFVVALSGASGRLRGIIAAHPGLRAEVVRDIGLLAGLNR